MRNLRLCKVHSGFSIKSVGALVIRLRWRLLYMLERRSHDGHLIAIAKADRLGFVRRLPTGQALSEATVRWTRPCLDAGASTELGTQYRDLLRQQPQINVLGGCCYTDHRHIACTSLVCRTAE